MKMFVTSSHLQLKSSTRLLIIKVRLFYQSLILRAFSLFVMEGTW